MEDGLYTFKYYLENKFPRNMLAIPANRTHELPAIPKDFLSPQPNNKAAINNKKLCDYISDINSYYREENRRYQEQSRDNLLRDFAFMLTPIKAHMDKLAEGLAKLVTESDNAQTNNMTEFETLKSLITKLGEESIRGFQCLVPKDGDAQAISLEGLRKDIKDDLETAMAENDFKRRGESTELKASFKTTLKAHTIPAQRGQGPTSPFQNPQAGARNVARLASLFETTRTPVQEQQQGTSADSNSNTNTNNNGTTTATNDTTEDITEDTTKIFTRPDFKKDTETGKFEKSWAKVAGKDRTKAPVPRGPVYQGSNRPRNADFELNDHAKAAAKDLKRKQYGESNASREVIFYNAVEPNPPNKLAELQHVMTAAKEISTEIMGSAGFDLMKSEIMGAQTSRIANYGGPKYTGILPLKVRFISNLTAENLLEAADNAGFNGKRRRVQIGKYKDMSKEEWKNTGPKFHIRQSETYEQRKARNEIREAYATQRTEHRNGEEYQRHLRMKIYEGESAHKFGSKECDEAYDIMFPGAPPDATPDATPLGEAITLRTETVVLGSAHISKDKDTPSSATGNDTETVVDESEMKDVEEADVVDEALKLQEDKIRKSLEKRKKDQDEVDEALRLQEDKIRRSLEKRKKDFLDESNAEQIELERLGVEHEVRKRKSIETASGSKQSTGNQDNIKSPEAKVMRMGLRSHSLSSEMEMNDLLTNTVIVEVPKKTTTKKSL